jgi:hypothetical protein
VSNAQGEYEQLERERDAAEEAKLGKRALEDGEADPAAKRAKGDADGDDEEMEIEMDMDDEDGEGESALPIWGLLG